MTVDWRRFLRQVVPGGAIGVALALLALAVRAWVTR
jgi:hypothetical protein